MIDRAMCALERTSLAAGARGRERIMACVTGRIDALAAGGVVALTEPNPLSEAKVSTSLAAGSDVDEDDIIVTPRLQVLRPGRWRFTEMRHPARSFTAGTVAFPSGRRRWG